jgi:hypothetical protein
MKTILLLAVILGAIFQFGCAAGPKQDAPVRDREQEKKAAKQQEEFARTLPKPQP